MAAKAVGVQLPPRARLRPLESIGSKGLCVFGFLYLRGRASVPDNTSGDPVLKSLPTNHLGIIVEDTKGSPFFPHAVSSAAQRFHGTQRLHHSIVG